MIFICESFCHFIFNSNALATVEGKGVFKNHHFNKFPLAYSFWHRKQNNPYREKVFDQLKLLLCFYPLHFRFIVHNNMSFFRRWGSFRKSEQNSINFYIVNENKNKNKSEKSCNNPLIKETMKKLYEDRNETGDVSFHVGSEVVRAHRSILSVHSPKFRVQFFGQNPDTGDIEVNDVSAAAFKEFLQFFYLENVSLSMDNIEDVLNLAKQSGVKEFMDQCVDFLFQIMTMDEIIWTYQLGIRYGIEKIRNFCEPLVSIYIKDLLVSDHFIQCAHQTFGEILKSDTLACRESELFDACISWAKAACKNSGEDATNSNLRSKLGSAIAQIRFGSMTADEFLCRHKLYKELFSPDESNEILYMIGKVDGVEPKFFNPTPRNQF